MDELLNLLHDLKPDADFSAGGDLIKDGVLTSLDVMTLAMELNDTFDIELTPLDLIPENFRSAETIYAMVQRLQEDG